MILNVSGRTDICAFYSKWFMNRYREGYVLVINHFYENMVSKINFDNVDLILFCTKNPLPMIPYLKEIDKPILFHVTLTSYKKNIEPNVIDKTKIIEGIKEISNIIGKDNIWVRYDPILLNDKYDVNYHIKAFDKMCNLLDGYVTHIITSFIDNYKNVEHNMRVLKYHEPSNEELESIGINFSNIAKEHGMSVQMCAEKNDLSEYGFLKGECMNATLAYKMTGKIFKKKWKERSCNCIEMVDIGVYNTCSHFCKYCYANFDEKRVLNNIKEHDDNSPFLIGNSKEGDIIKERK